MLFSHINFQTFAWFASIVYALEVVTTKFMSKHGIKNPWLLNFFLMGFTLLLTIPFGIYYHAAGLPAHFLNVFWAGIFWGLASILYVLALYRMDVSSLSPLYNIRTAFAIILAALFLAERLSVLQFILIAFMFFGGILVTLDERMSWRSIFTWGGFFAMLDMLALALMAVFIKKSIVEIGFWPATLWMFIIGQLLFCLTLPLFFKEIKNLLARDWALLLLIAVLDLIATLAANKAYTYNVSITAAIISIPISSVIALVFSVFAPKLLEHHPVKVYVVRFLGAALIVYAGIKLI